MTIAFKWSWLVFVVLSATAWAFLKLHLPLGPVQDFYHESEYFGNLPVFLKTNAPLLHSYFIHGIGIDGLASYWGYLLSNGENTLMMTRWVRHLQGLLAWVGSFWVIWELVQQSKIQSKIFAYFILIVTFLSLNNTYYSLSIFSEVHPPARQGVYAFQVALLLCALRKKSWVLAFLSGAFAFGGLAYNYSFGGLFFLGILGIFFLLSIYRGELKRVWIGTGAGLVAGVFLWTAFLGWEQFKAIFEQVYLLISFGKSVQSSQPIHFGYFIQVAITHALAVVLLVRKMKSPQVDASRLFQVLFLLPVAFVHLDYGMHYLDHWFWSAVSSFYLLVAVALWIYDSIPVLDKKLMSVKHWVTVLLCGYMIFWAYSRRNDMSIGAAVERVNYYQTKLSKPDRELFPAEYLAMKEQIVPFLHNEPCLYVLRSPDIMFNYLLGMISCSRFSTFQISQYIPGKDEFTRNEFKQKGEVVFIAPADGSRDNEIKYLFEKTVLLTSTKEFLLYRGFAHKESVVDSAQSK